MMCRDWYFTSIFNCTHTSTDAPDLKIMLLSRAWTQAGIDTLKTDARATYKGDMKEEERALTQAGKSYWTTLPTILMMWKHHAVV